MTLRHYATWIEGSAPKSKRDILVGFLNAPKRRGSEHDHAAQILPLFGSTIAHF